MPFRYDTMNAVEPDGSSDFRDAHDNTGNLDLAMNGAALAWTDRLGRSKKSWAGIEDQVNGWLDAQGFEPGVLEYVDGSPLTVDRPTQLIQRGDNIYSVKRPASFPVNLTGNWATDQNLLVAQVDRTLQATLATSAGAGMIGYRERTVADRLNDTANVKDYGAIADGAYHPLSERFATLADAQAVYPHATALTDSIDWAAYQAAINSGSPHVHAPGGHYVMNRGTLAERDIRYTGDGYATRVDFSLADGPGSCMLTRGELVQIGTLGATINRGDRAITFSAPPDVVSGDVIIVYNPTDGSWLADRPSYRAGEMWRVHSVSGSVVTVYGNSTSTYASGAVQVYRMRGVRCTVEDMHFSPSDYFGIAAFMVTFGDKVRCSRVYSSDVDRYTVLEVDRCFDVLIQATSGINWSPSVNDEYGLTISNCHNVIVASASGSATRHAVAIGGNDVVCCVPNRNILLYGLILENIDLSSDTYSGDMHGNTDNVTYDNCVFRSGVLMSGRNPTVRNSLIYGASSTSGECVYGTECQGGVYTLENCRLVSYGDGFATGIIHISPGSSLAEELLLTVRNVTVEAPNATANTDVVCLRPRNSASQNCNALIDGLQLRSSIARCFLRADDQVLSSMNAGYLIVDNVFGPAGTALILSNAKISNVPTRQMRQSGFVDITTSAAQVNTATAQSYRYPYSKMPTAVSPGVYSNSGGDQGVLGTVAPIPKVYSLSSTAIRPAIMAPSGSFAAGSTVRLGWEVCINEV
ncbi:hypothetical protein [Pseudomonas aeruginosa]|uniref:phage tailspike polysaccharide lyase family protein n=1 Tax=Pseudomonas aeruginosa TaxID=287 RepID=UPI000F84C0F5|nr:hypothetical protein [Pseudomonas aeruginosa]RTU74446.1 hypothetical protein DY982_20165 [Pseudomonas aeruginosa]